MPLRRATATILDEAATSSGAFVRLNPRRGRTREGIAEDIDLPLREGRMARLGRIIRERLHERIIVMSHARLEERVLGLLKRALSEGRLDVADHLLKALEALCHDERPSASVAAAYLAIGKRPPRRSLAGTARM
jgi:hypothetical protein